MRQASKIKIYLIARISKDAHRWNNWVCKHLTSSVFEVFKPQEHNPWNKHRQSFSKRVFEVDLQAIKRSHMGLLLPEFGKDCAWECGWYGNSKKPLVVFVDAQTAWLRDWMIKGGVDCVVTNNVSTHKFLKKDPILKHKKLILIENIRGLNGVLSKFTKSRNSWAKPLLNN